MTSLMLMVTMGCNSECAHCCFVCNPEKRRLSMSKDEMVSYIKQVHDYGIRGVSFTGGEPMLLDLEVPMLLANDLGMYIDIRTNAFWAKNYRKTLDILQCLQFQGLVRLGLSYDGYHAKAIPINNVINVLKASRKLYLPVYLDWIGLETREQVLECLCMNKDELRHVGPTLKIGAATKLSHKHFRYMYTKDLHSECRSEMLLTIFPGGYASLHPCCWVNPALIRKISGNGWMKQLAEEMKDSPMVNFLREKGVQGLIEKAKNECPQLIKPYYSRHCEACYDLLGPLFPEEIQELPEYLKELKGDKYEMAQKA